ncbi:MAG: OmpA family protein [Rickettsiales bacterium]|nr:OmpA family protein [Rickettsiales bacterium]
MLKKILVALFIAVPFAARAELHIGNVIFKFDSASEFINYEELAAELETIQYPQCERFIIRGHASFKGDAGYNQDLSGQRARSIVKILQNLGVPSENITIVARGIEECDDDQCINNRRAEVVLHERTSWWDRYKCQKQYKK